MKGFLFSNFKKFDEESEARATRRTKRRNRLNNKQKGQITTFYMIRKNNSEIFSKQYPRSEGEPDSHYIAKVYLGESIRRRFGSLFPSEDCLVYEHPLGPVDTSMGPRPYQCDIFVQYYNHDTRTVHILDLEINGDVHYKNATQYAKNVLRRDSITEHFRTYTDPMNPAYTVIFSYIVLKPDDFLYLELDFFLALFEKYKDVGGYYPTVDLYEKYIRVRS